MTVRNGVSPPGMVPCAPILRVVDQWLDEQSGPAIEHQSGQGHANRLGQIGPLSPLKVLAYRVYPHNPENLWRALSRMRNESASVTFDLADRLVSGTYGPQHWHADPELERLYTRYVRDADMLLDENQIAAWAAATWASFTDHEQLALRTIMPAFLELDAEPVAA